MHIYRETEMTGMISRRLGVLRRSRRMTQSQAGEFLHVSDSTLSSIERGQIPSVTDLFRCAELYGTSLNGLSGVCRACPFAQRLPGSDEMELLNNYRTCPPWVQTVIRSMCTGFCLH